MTSWRPGGCKERGEGILCACQCYMKREWCLYEEKIVCEWHHVNGTKRMKKHYITDRVPYPDHLFIENGV